MNIIVCTKRVPDTNEVDMQISGNSVATQDLVFDINEWDKYAIEEAIIIKEKTGGSVTAITAGNADSDDVLRRAFATGADDAIRITDDTINGSDAIAMAKVLAAAIKDLKYDLVFFGAQADDDGFGATGQAAATFLGLPYASLVVKLELLDGKVRATRELEAGMHEIVELPTPAVITVQSGINEPRYVSIMGIRKASSKEIKTVDTSALGLNTAEIGTDGSGTKIEKLFIPPVLKQTDFITGSAAEISSKLAQILKDKGGTI